MFDLQFYNMIVKCYIIKGYNSKITINKMNATKTIDFGDDVIYANTYSVYISSHVIYFNPNCPLRNRRICSISYKQ